MKQVVGLILCVALALGCIVSEAHANALEEQSQGATLAVGGEALGVKQQALMGPGISVIFTFPLGVVGLAPLIGNIVVVIGDWHRSTRLGWGITGVVVGSIGLVITSLMWAADRPSSGDSFNALRDIVNPAMIAIHGATLALSIVNLVKANQKRFRPRPGMAQRLAPFPSVVARSGDSFVMSAQ